MITGDSTSTTSSSRSHKKTKKTNTKSTSSLHYGKARQTKTKQHNGAHTHPLFRFTPKHMLTISIKMFFNVNPLFAIRTFGTAIDRARSLSCGLGYQEILGKKTPQICKNGSTRTKSPLFQLPAKPYPATTSSHPNVTESLRHPFTESSFHIHSGFYTSLLPRVHYEHNQSSHCILTPCTLRDNYVTPLALTTAMLYSPLLYPSILHSIVYRLVSRLALHTQTPSKIHPCMQSCVCIHKQHSPSAGITHIVHMRY